MNKQNKNKHYFKTLLLIIIVLTLIISVLLLLLPFDFKLKESNESIKAEVIDRIENVAELRDNITFISFTPFMWDEGYFINNTVDEAGYKSLINNRAKFKKLSDDEQRLIFFYKGQSIADLLFVKDAVDFDIQTGKIEDGWLSIQSSSDGAWRIY